MASVTTAYSLDGTYRRHDSVVIAGSPLRLFRLSTAGRRVVEAIEQRLPLPAGHTRLTDRLVDAAAGPRLVGRRIVRQPGVGMSGGSLPSSTTITSPPAWSRFG